MTTSYNSEAFGVAEACGRLGHISRKSFYALIRAGDLTTFKIGSRRYVSTAAIADFIKQRESVSNGDKMSP